MKVDKKDAFLIGAISFFVIILLIVTFLFPLIISFATGNWRYCWLFLVSWIPFGFEIALLDSILDSIILKTGGKKSYKNFSHAK